MGMVVIELDEINWKVMKDYLILDWTHSFYTHVATFKENAFEELRRILLTVL